MTHTSIAPIAFRLREEVKQRWVDELESGRWEQGTNRLGSAETIQRCCLGVLCEIAVQQGVTSKAELPGGAIAYGGVIHHLPRAVREWAFVGVSSENPYLKFTREELATSTLHTSDIPPEDGKTPVTAASANDGGVPFSAIANAIRRTL